jgi:hypothetical protein
MIACYSPNANHPFVRTRLIRKRTWLPLISERLVDRAIELMLLGLQGRKRLFQPADRWNRQRRL